MQLSGPRSRMGVRFGLQLALWRYVQSSRTCWGFRWLSFFLPSSASSGRASRLTSSSGSLLSGHGLIHGGPSCWASCAACLCCLMTACILTSSGITLLMRRAHCRVPAGLGALKSSLLLWAWPLLLSPLVQVLLTVMALWTGWLGSGNGPGMACMCPLGQLPLRESSCARIIIGLAAPARFVVSLIMSCL